MMITFEVHFLFVEQKNFPFLKWQYMAGAGAGAKIREKVEPEPELELKLNNFCSVTLVFSFYSFLSPMQQGVPRYICRKKRREN